MSDIRYVLGIDGGGSKCDAVIMDEQGTVLGWGRGGSTHGLYVGGDVAANSVRDSVLGALPNPVPKISRIAGHGPRGNLEEWLEQPVTRDMFVGVGEQSAGLATAFATHGLLVLSGTGSFVHGLTADGRSLHEGGNGAIIADEGSAHHIGILGIRAAFRSQYSNARQTSLAEVVPQAMGVASLREVFDMLYVDRIGRAEIAAVARTVDAEAEGGDRVAAGVLQRAAGELGELLVEVVHELEMEDSTDLMVATGTVAQNSRIFWERLSEIAHGVAPGLRPVQPKVRPVIGGCLLALRDLGVEWNDALMDRIIETQEPFLARL